MCCQINCQKVALIHGDPQKKKKNANQCSRNLAKKQKDASRHNSEPSSKQAGKEILCEIGSNATRFRDGRPGLMFVISLKSTGACFSGPISGGVESHRLAERERVRPKHFWSKSLLSLTPSKQNVASPSPALFVIGNLLLISSKASSAALRQSVATGRGFHAYLSVRVLMVLVIAGVVVLLDEAKILLPLPLQDVLSPLSVGWQVTLRKSHNVREIYCEFFSHT